MSTSPQGLLKGGYFYVHIYRVDIDVVPSLKLPRSGWQEHAFSTVRSEGNLYSHSVSGKAVQHS